MTRSINRRRSSPRLHHAAIALAALALFVALGGTSDAAGILIGTKQIKKNAVATKKIRNGHVGSPDLKNKGVQSVDLADGRVELADPSGALKAQFGGLLADPSPPPSWRTTA